MAAVGPVLATVFHEIERRFDGRPTLVVIDEAWSALDLLAEGRNIAPVLPRQLDARRY